QSLFPNRKVIGIDSTELIWGLGSFHCISQQEPA
ncbi:MAG: agmatine deiminase family protein, partial [Limisphaerales bacterium]